jgi:hypothetical protein
VEALKRNGGEERSKCVEHVAIDENPLEEKS